MKFIRVIKSGLLNKNSLGEPISNDPQVLQNFWNWFGDSKAVNPKGRPYVFYHGTDAKFNIFDKNKQQTRDYGWYGVGFSFTWTYSYAKTYGKYVLRTYLKYSNPFDETKFRFFSGDIKEFLKATKELQAEKIFDDKDLEELYNFSSNKENIIENMKCKLIDGDSLKNQHYEVYLDNKLIFKQGPGWLNNSEKLAKNQAYNENIKIFCPNEEKQDQKFYAFKAKYAKKKSEFLKNKGYDAIISGGLGEIVVFEPNQIKSVSNNTNYSKEYNSIYGGKL